MSLQGSIHTWSDGIGYGAFVPTDCAYFNVRTPKVSGRQRRPSSEQLREYRRNNVTAGIDTHRSDVSFGKTTESIRGGLDGDSRAREATKSLTSGEVGGFRWPAERARDGDVETILASSSAAASTSSLSVSGGGEGSKSSPPPNILPARSMKHHEQAAETKINSARERRRQPALLQQQQQQRQLGQVAINTLSARSRTSTCSIVTGSSTQRSDSTCAPSCGSSADSYSSRRSRSRSSASSAGDSHNEGGRSSRSGSSTSTGHRTRPATSYGVSNEGAIPPTSNTAYMQQLSHRSGNSRSNGRENRLRPPKILGQDTPTPSTTPKLPRFRVLDPVFDKHHKYDMVAEERAAQGGEVTGRFGPVHGSSVLAASLLTSELSTPWSHVLRGQKW